MKSERPMRKAPASRPKREVLAAEPIREAPAPNPTHVGSGDPSHPPVADEPVLEIEDIQGNILGGFSKDFQTLLYLHITNAKAFQGWLKNFIPLVATSSEVIAFNRLFKSLRRRRGESSTAKATWVNIAFSYPGFWKMAEVVPDLLKPDFTDEAFRQGLAARSEQLGDETAPNKPGNKKTWKIGGPGNEADVIVIVASDERDDLQEEVKAIVRSLQGAHRMKHGMDHGATLPLALGLRGHEHFGFLDGVSQPGIRGRVSADPTDVLTPRQNPNERGQGKPGQDLLWPGEFVIGYPGQDPKAADISVPGPESKAGPEWARNGSFLVFRRLRQEVFRLHSFLKESAQQTGIKIPSLVGSRLVGRWKSGAPALRTPVKDIPALGGDDCANNNFEFQGATPPIPKKESDFDCEDHTFPTSPGDPAGQRCPFSGHIRKAYPRDDTSKDNPTVGEVTTQTHRILRRGIPFGKASKSTPERPINDGNVDRGLLFLAYQTSIARQFEFVTKNWVNNKNFKDQNSGHDPVIGQNNTPGQNRQREFTVTDANGKPQRLQTTTDWVIPVGGGYFFAPSIKGLRKLAGV